jgi:hypothetical protein
VSDILVTAGGSGYIRAPFVYLTGGGGTGANADAMLVGDIPLDMKNVTEGFDPWYGRMNLVLGTTPVPLNPTAQAPQVPGLAYYIDPPSDFWYDGKVQIFRLAHLGVDSHPIHFHLANLQVVNRVDATNTMMPPDPNELGWRETVRTNPFTDLILAVKPKSMVLPFAIPRSSRLLDPTTIAGSTANWVQPAPIPGTPTPAGISNVLTDYNWEYVWHCHILGHEEFDGMRPIVFNPILMSAPTGSPAPIAAPYAHYASTASPNFKNPAITWTVGTITNPPAGTFNYQFSLNNGTTNTVVRVYSTTTTWAMPINTYPIGSYTLTVDARRTTALSTDPPDATGTIDFDIVPPAATGVTLTPSVVSPAAYPITFTAAGTGSTGYQYRFNVNGVVAQDYSTTATFTLPVSTPPGTYSISVDVRTSPLSTTPDHTTTIASYSVLAPSTLMYAGFTTGLSGIYSANGTSLTQINTAQPQIMAAAGSVLYASFAGIGIWQWDLGIWTQINAANPAIMVASATGPTLYASGLAGQPGVWKWNGTAWSQLSAINPTKMVASGSVLYVSGVAGNPGVWEWTGAAWSQLSGIDPTNMLASGSVLYVSGVAGNPGVWAWTGAAWSQLNGIDPTNIAASGSVLYASGVAGYPGVWAWTGAAWSQLSGINPTNIAASGSVLYVSGVTGYPGVWEWTGAAWSQLSGIDPTNMLASGSVLYVSGAAGYPGIWAWTGAAWSQLDAANPAIMVSGL